MVYWWSYMTWVPWYVLEVFVDIYRNSEASTMLNHRRSQWFSASQCVRQGGVCSAFFYLVHINELLTDITTNNIGSKIGDINCSCPTLADDVTLLANSPNGLQKLLNTVYEYSCKWRYEINATKSNIVIFSKNKNTRNQKLNLKLGDKEIPQIEHLSHLGVRQEGSRSTMHRTRDACQKAKNAFFGLTPIARCSLKRTKSDSVYTII